MKKGKKKVSRKIKRKCTVCGKSISVLVYPDGHHRGGYYFGAMEISVGEGNYKKVGTIKMLGGKHDVVKWTGKNKEVEYWECDKCFEGAAHECWLEEKIEKVFGKRCPDHEQNRFLCQAWQVYDAIRDFDSGKD